LYDNRTSLASTYSAAGAGAVEALIGCIKQAMSYEVRLVELEVHSMYNGESSSEASEGEAEVTLEVEGDMFIANGIDTDIAFAAAKAYLAACNQAVHKTLQIVPQI
jgi:2-isopropylmalate synthase